MRDFQLSWSIEGETQLSRRLIGLGNSLRDYRKPFTRSANLLTSLFRGPVFETRGAEIGEKWKRLSPYTVAQKARSGQPSDPLVGSGRMRRSFRSIVSTDQAVVYNTSEYFKYHQSRLPRATIPRRVMMKIDQRRREEITKIFQRYIMDEMRRT